MKCNYSEKNKIKVKVCITSKNGTINNESKMANNLSIIFFSYSFVVHIELREANVFGIYSNNKKVYLNAYVLILSNL